MRRAARRRLLRRAVRRDRHDATAPPGRELHGPRRAGVERVVLADPDALAGMEAGAALADDDLAACHVLAREDLDAQALGVRIAPVAGGAEPLLMSHSISP